MSSRTPDTYHPAGPRRGTVTANFHPQRDNLEGVYLASESSLYRILRAHDSTRERRRQATHPPRSRPELVAHGPLAVWSWDITKLRGPQRGLYYDLYVVIDIFSRYVVAWCVAASEDGELAKELIAAAVARHRVPPGQLTIHADRGSSMTSNPVTELLSFLGIGRSHSRPHVSNDNPYSGAQFKTLEYCPAFPERFGSIQDARAFCQVFFDYYNHEHRSPASATTPRRRSTTARPRRSAPSGPRPSTPPTRPTRPGSAVGGRCRRSPPPWRGSTTPTRRSHRRHHRNVSQSA